MGARRCEDCATKQPNFGMAAEGRARWCGACAKSHAGASNLNVRNCEDCGLKARSYGEAFTSKGTKAKSVRRRWCGSCARKSHAGAVCLVQSTGNYQRRPAGGGGGGSSEASPLRVGGVHSLSAAAASWAWSPSVGAQEQGQAGELPPGTRRGRP